MRVLLPSTHARRSGGAEARFSTRAFAKLLGSSEAKIDAALGRSQPAPGAVATGGVTNGALLCVVEAPASLSFDVVLLRQIEAKVTQLRADGFASLGAELDAVLVSKKRVPSAAAAENVPPVAGTLQLGPFTLPATPLALPPDLCS